MDEQAFLRSICCDPTDITPRLFFADWLEENCGQMQGDEVAIRVELIRMGSGYLPQIGALIPKCLWRLPRLIRTTLADLLPKTYRIRIVDDTDRHFKDRDLTYGYSVLNGNMGQNFELRDVFVLLRHGFIESIALNQGLFIRPGFAKGLFERHPIRDVYLTRQNPGYSVDSDARSLRHTWLRDGLQVGTWPQNMIAVPIWDLLESYTEGVASFSGSHQYKVYADGATSAFAALSAACVRWGRQLAELPEWNPKEETNGVTSDI